jgi:hypothetical protein
MGKKTLNAAGWFLLQLLFATLLSSCTFENNIEEFRRKQRAGTEENTNGAATPAAADFAVSGLSQIYDGSPKRVIITPKQGKSDGVITIYYEGAGGTAYTKSTSAPSALGTYAVTFDVAEATGWKAVSGLSAGMLAVSEQTAFTSIAELDAWLVAQPANTASKPYTVALNISDLGGDYSTAGSLGNVLRANNDKYLSLDLSGSTFTGIPDFAFYDLGTYNGSNNLIGITIPNGVTNIGDGAFTLCSSLAAVTIPSSVTRIGVSAFYGCGNLTGVTIPGGVTSIENGTFAGCSSLTGVTIPDGVTSIGDGAFVLCSGLTGIAIPGGVTSIGYRAFAECSSLASVTFEGTIASTGFDVDAFWQIGDLRSKFYTTDPANGTPGTYTTTAPVSDSSVWTLQP